MWHNRDTNIPQYDTQKNMIFTCITINPNYVKSHAEWDKIYNVTKSILFSTCYSSLFFCQMEEMYFSFAFENTDY